MKPLQFGGTVPWRSTQAMNYDIVTQIMVAKMRKILPALDKAGFEVLQQCIWEAIRADRETASMIANHEDHKLCPMCGGAPQLSNSPTQGFSINCRECNMGTKFFGSDPVMGPRQAWQAWDRRSEVR
jgi:hypothetical protein